MATCYDVDPPYRDLAARVPEDIRESLSPLDLQLRCAEAFQIIADADDLTDEVKKSREKARAAKVLKAASPDSYAIVMRVMGDELGAARLDGDDRQAYEIQCAMRDYARRNPQPDPQTVMAAANAMVTRLRIPPPMPSNRSALTRRFGRKTR